MVQGCDEQWTMMSSRASRGSDVRVVQLPVLVQIRRSANCSVSTGLLGSADAILFTAPEKFDRMRGVRCPFTHEANTLSFSNFIALSVANFVAVRLTEFI